MCPFVQKIVCFVRDNPNLALASLLFFMGILFIFSPLMVISGALFGAGAALLGGWVTQINERRAYAEKQKRLELEALRKLRPELQRVVERVLFIHQRATVNFTSSSVAHSNGEANFKPHDLRHDFIPHMPVLYPASPLLNYLGGDEAVALIAFYDSLQSLLRLVDEWWARQGQLPVVIFLAILNSSKESLRLAETCIDKFGVEADGQPSNEAWTTLPERISSSIRNSDMALSSHLERNNAG